MSGSIGASRIKHSVVQETLDFYIEKVLKPFKGFVSAKATGSTVDPNKPDHGDIDITVHIEGEDLKQLKKDFKAYLESLPDDITMPFPSGNNKGKKAQMYGAIVTCMCPIQGFERIGVQIDNNIVLTAEEQEYNKSFLDLPAAKQALVMGLARVILQEEKPEKVFERLGIKKLPALDKNQEFEFVISGSSLTLRKITVGPDFKELSREVIWTSHNWKDVEKLLQGYDLTKSYEELLDSVKNKITSSRSRRRIVGIMSSMINIGPGEVGTPKGDGKQRAIDAARANLDEIEVNSDAEPVKTVALYGGGFKPPHKAHFANAEALCKKAERLIIFIGPKVREGVPITAEQSKKIWDIYAKYLNKPVEIRIADKTPIASIYSVLENPELSDTEFIVGIANTAEDRKKFAYLEKNKDKYKNVKLDVLPVIEDKDNEKFSATTLRQSVEKIKEGSWIPKCLDRDDAIRVIETLTKPLETQILQEEFKLGVIKTLAEVRGINEGSSGTPIALTSVVSSKSRAELATLYYRLGHELEPEFEVKFNQSFIDIKGDSQDRISELYTTLFSKYSSEYSVNLDRGRVIIRPFRHPENSDCYDLTGGYRTDAENQRVQEAVEDPNEIQEFDWASNLASMIGFMQKKGLKLDPLPDIILNKEAQNTGLLDKSGQYNPNTNVLELFIAGRHPVDILRTAAHELWHVHQNNDGKLKQISTEQITKDKELKDIEGEAFREGNLIYREWLESLGKYRG